MPTKTSIINPISNPKTRITPRISENAMNIPSNQLDPIPPLCEHCAGSGQIESMDYGGTATCRYCYGSGLEYSRSCRRCVGRGIIVDENREASRCPICGGVGRMPNARIRSRERDPISGIESPRMSYEYASPADIESARRPELDNIITRQNVMSQIMAANPEKTLRCLRIAQLIFRNTIIAPDQKIGTMANILTQLPDSSIETIRNLLEDFTVESEKPLKLLNRFEILKKE